jgi:hypothetical protein
MQANARKSVHVTFTTRTGMCPPVHINNVQLPCPDQVKYLGLHLDIKLTWHHHIFTKRNQLGPTGAFKLSIQPYACFNIDIFTCTNDFR